MAEIGGTTATHPSDGQDKATTGEGPEDPSPPAAEHRGETEPSSRAYRRRRGRPSRARGQPNSSDAAAARWTIRGVPPHIRDMALKAADARSMTVGDWLAEAIIGMARGAQGPAATEPRSNLPATETPPDLVGMITRLENRLTRLEERQTLGFFARLFGRRK